MTFTVSYNISNINILVNQFHSILYDSIDMFVTRKQIHNLFPIWFSSTLKHLLKEKKIAHLIKSISHYLKFSHLRAKYKKLAKYDYKNYINKVQSSIKQNPKYFWKFINNTIA